MNGDDAGGRSGPEESRLASMGIGSSILVIVLLAILVATGVFVLFGWSLGGDFSLPAWGYVSMALGVVLSLAVGCGLMALLFYSNRKGYDEPPVLISPEAEPDESKEDQKT